MTERATTSADKRPLALVVRADDRSVWLGFLSVTFVPFGMLAYVLIGLPCAGIIAGWIIARDNIMGADSDDEADRDQQRPSGPNTDITDNARNQG